MTDTQPAAPSAGALLRAAREKQGLHIAALAAAIKVAPRKLDALENDRWQDLPDATFTRALAQTVCRTLKIDARPVLALLPAATVLPLEPVGNAMNQPFRERPGRDGSGFGTTAIRPMVWAAAVLMVAALVVYFVPPEVWTARTAAPASGVVLAPAAPAASLAPAAASAPAGTGPALVSAAESPASVAAMAELAASAAASGGSGAAPAASAAVVAEVAAATAGETVFSAPAGAAASAPAAAGLLQLSSSEASWVDVRDARGNVLLSRTVQPGESVGLNGSLPIRLTIGNAAGTKVLFRGQPVDLMARTRENVARVELQ